eukprot:UN04291
MSTTLSSTVKTIEQIELLLDNLQQYHEVIPPPNDDIFYTLQQIILSAFPDKLAWRMSDEAKEQLIQRYQTYLNAKATNNVEVLSQMGEPIKLKPRPTFYNEQIKTKIALIRQRFINKQDHPDYALQLAEVAEQAPLTMKDLDHAYQILDSDEPVFLSPVSALYLKQRELYNNTRHITQDTLTQLANNGSGNNNSTAVSN